MFTKASENFGVVQVVSTCQYVGIKIVLYVMLLCAHCQYVGKEIVLYVVLLY